MTQPCLLTFVLLRCLSRVRVREEAHVIAFFALGHLSPGNKAAATKSGFTTLTTTEYRNSQIGSSTFHNQEHQVQHRAFKATLPRKRQLIHQQETRRHYNLGSGLEPASAGQAEAATCSALVVLR